MVDSANYRALAAIRLRSHCLAIETGGWQGLPLEDRCCPRCSVLEDEMHFLFDCDIYNDLREHHLPEEYYVRGSIENVVNLLNTDNLKVLNNLALYIRKALNRRRENY